MSIINIIKIQENITLDNIFSFYVFLFLFFFHSQKVYMSFHASISKKLKSFIHKRQNNQYYFFWYSLMDAVKRNKREIFNSEEKLKIFVSFAHGFLYFGSLFVLSVWWQIWYVWKSFISFVFEGYIFLLRIYVYRIKTFISLSC